MVDRDILKSELAPTPQCLSIDELGKLSAEQAGAHRHVSVCARCQTELALLREFESDKPMPGEGAAVAWMSAQLERRLGGIKNTTAETNRSRAASIQSSWLARLFAIPGFPIAAPIAAAAIVAAALLWLRSPREPELQANLGSGPTVYRSTEVQTIAPIGNLQKTPDAMQWKAVERAASYKILLSEVDQTEVWTAQTSDTSLTIPRAVVAKMKVGKPFLWKVSALDTNGQVLATSQPQRFVIVPDQTR